MMSASVPVMFHRLSVIFYCRNKELTNLESLFLPSSISLLYLPLYDHHATYQHHDSENEIVEY